MNYKIEKLYAIGNIQFEVSVAEEYESMEIQFRNSNNATLGPAIVMLSPTKEVLKTFDIPGKYAVEFKFTKTKGSEEMIWREGMIQSKF